MATWPCPTILDCDCLENPFRNLSSEDPDPPNHFARSYPPFPTLVNSPIDTFKAPGCIGDCFSVVSQFDADACALREATICNHTTPTGNLPGPVLVGNEAQSCQVACAMGDPFVYSIPAGTFLAVNQELANLIAQSFCYNQAFSLRHCETPPGPPVLICPRINSVSPAGPVHANVGDNVTLTASYSFPGSASALMFVWFLDGEPIAILHDDPTLFLTGIMESDAGSYTLGVLANGCSPVFSNSIVINVSNCPLESGSPAPTTLDIMHTTDWETYTIDNPDLAPLVSSSAGCNPTGLFTTTPSNGLDHSPGVYGFRYITGFFGGVDPFCPAITPISGSVNIYQIVDEENNFDNPTVCNLQGLAHECRTMAGDPPPAGNFGGGLVINCASNNADVIAQLQAFWADKTFICDPYPPDSLLDFSHSNTGGQFSVYMIDDGVTPIAVPLQVKIVQASGQIPQPRKLAIFNYAALIPQFSNPAAAANWDGTFQTRDNFDSTQVNWIAPGGGSFGGAKVEWINSHPTSSNGYGWRITLHNQFLVPFYSAIKAVDATSEGRYYREASSPGGPDCIVIDDLSDTIWYPGTHP